MLIIIKPDLKFVQLSGDDVEVLIMLLPQFRDGSLLPMEKYPFFIENFSVDQNES